MTARPVCQRTLSVLLLFITAAALTQFAENRPRPAQAAYLESDVPGEPTPVPPRPEPIPPPPVLDNPTTRLIRGVELGPAIRWGSLTLFPITLAGAEPVADISPLSTAVARGWVAIEEDKPAVVSRAVLVNRSDRLVLVLAGELISGGQQHRSSQHDLLLLPHTRVTVDLYCVEQGRWAGGGKLEAAGRLAPQSVRRGNLAGADQARVWNDVRQFNESAGVQSRTDSLLAGLDDKAVRDQLADCRREVLPRLPANCVGLVAGRNGRIFAADVFVDAELFAAYRQLLIDSYAAEEVSWRLRQNRAQPGDQREGREQLQRDAHRRWPILPPPTQPQARQFLNDALRAEYGAIATPGGGSLWRLTGPATGQALDYRGQAVHVGLTEPTPRPIPMPRPLPPPHPVPLPEPIPRR